MIKYKVQIKLIITKEKWFKENLFKLIKVQYNLTYKIMNNKIKGNLIKIRIFIKK